MPIDKYCEMLYSHSCMAGGQAILLAGKPGEHCRQFAPVLISALPRFAIVQEGWFMRLPDSGLHRRLAKVGLALCMLVAIAGRPSASQAAGIITHDLITQRAINRINEESYPGLADLLNDYPEVVNYGAMFPDWAYALGDGNLAELAHDTAAGQSGAIGPFRAALTANLLHSFRNPTSQDDRKAVAFLLGLISHDDADIPYHFGDGTGLGLQPLAEQAGIRHMDFELGSDLYLAPTLSSGVDWFLPLGALLAAYKTLDPNDDYHVNATKLRIGRVIHQGQYILESAAALVVDPCLAFGHGECKEESKEFYQLIESYPAGGLQHCAGRTTKGWQDTWDWLSSYTPVTTMTLSPALPGDDTGLDRQPITVTLSATDNFHGWIDTGPFETMYSLDGGATWLTYTGPFVIPPDGVSRFSVYSIDSLGNRETVQSPIPTISG
jgi:hypothetical protein